MGIVAVRIARDGHRFRSRIVFAVLAYWLREKKPETTDAPDLGVSEARPARLAEAPTRPLYSTHDADWAPRDAEAAPAEAVPAEVIPAEAPRLTDGQKRFRGRVEWAAERTAPLTAEAPRPAEAPPDDVVGELKRLLDRP